MFPKKSISLAFTVVREPLATMRSIASRPLEESIGKYLILLVYSGVVAGLVSLLWAVGRGVYLDLVRDITIDYWRLINYFGQVFMVTIFLYLFFGTFVLFCITLIVHRFAAHARYIQVVAVTCASTAPLLLFGWVNYRVLIVLLVWMFLLLTTGVQALHETRQELETPHKTPARAKKK